MTSDIVIPARGETDTLAGCLGSLLHERMRSDIKIIVVVNGPRRDPTLTVAHGFSVAFREAGIQFVVLEEPEPGKANAMNRGDQETRSGSVIYLDADTVLLPGTLAALARALASVSVPILVSPRPQLVAPRGMLARHWALIWRTLPAVAGDVVGTGCYGVNRAGRARWERFPQVLGDDAFVRSRFSRSERRLLDDADVGGFLQVLPEGHALAASLQRWRAANDALRTVPAADRGFMRKPRGSFPGATLASNLFHVIRNPDLWVYLPGFLLMSWAGMYSPRKSYEDFTDAAWEPIRENGCKDIQAASGSLHVAVVIIGPLGAEFSAGAQLSSCRWAAVTFVPANKLQNSGKYRQLGIMAPLLRDGLEHLMHWVRPQDDGVSHVLLLHAAALQRSGIIDALLAIALRFPRAGIYCLSSVRLDQRAPWVVRPWPQLGGKRGDRSDSVAAILVSTSALQSIGPHCEPPATETLAGAVALAGWCPVLIQAPPVKIDGAIS